MSVVELRKCFPNFIIFITLFNNLAVKNKPSSRKYYVFGPFNTTTLFSTANCGTSVFYPNEPQCFVKRNLGVAKCAISTTISLKILLMLLLYNKIVLTKQQKMTAGYFGVY